MDVIVVELLDNDLVIVPAKSAKAKLIHPPFQQR